MDELLPKATGFAAKIEKKRARAEQRRERDISPGITWWDLPRPQYLLFPTTSLSIIIEYCAAQCKVYA